MDDRTLPGAGDNGMNRPNVTPDPAPSDDQLIRMAKFGSIATAIVALVISRWLHKNVEVRWRR